MKAKITTIVQETETISSFRLQPEQSMSYKPGQWMYVKLSENLKHHFTISSSPTEPFLQFTTMFRSESDYKQNLFAKKIGDTLDINGAFGNFALDESDTNPRLFIAGGIGITPFRSMTKYISDKKLTLDINLLYSVKNTDESIFVTSYTKIIQTELEGRIDQIKIKKYCPDYVHRSWWICGPPAFVDAMFNIGAQLHISPDKLRSEALTGY